MHYVPVYHAYHDLIHADPSHLDEALDGERTSPSPQTARRPPVRDDNQRVGASEQRAHNLVGVHMPDFCVFDPTAQSARARLGSAATLTMLEFGNVVPCSRLRLVCLALCELFRTSETDGTSDQRPPATSDQRARTPATSDQRPATSEQPGPEASLRS